MSSITRGATVNLFFRVLGVVLAFAITMITARLGTEERGTYSLLTLMASIVTTVFSGLGPAIAYHATRQRPTSQMVSDGLAFGTLAGVAIALTLLALVKLFPYPPYSYFGWLAVAAPTLMWITVANGAYLGLGRMLPLNLNTVSAPATLLLICLALALFHPPLSLDGVMIAWVGSQIGAALLAAIFLGRQIGLTRPAPGRLRADARFMGHIGLANVISVLNYRADLFLVQWFIGLSATGVYSIAIAVAELLWFISSSLTIAVYQRIGASDSSDAAALTLRVVHLNLVLLLLAAPVLAAVAWWGLPWLVGSQYQAAQGVLWLLLPGVALYGSASSLSAYYTNHLGRPGISTAIAALSTAINVAGSAVLIPWLGLYGGALGSSIAYVLSLWVSLILFARHARIRMRDVVRPDLHQVGLDIRHMGRSLLQRGG